MTHAAQGIPSDVDVVRGKSGSVKTHTPTLAIA